MVGHDRLHVADLPPRRTGLAYPLTEKLLNRRPFGPSAAPRGADLRRDVAVARTPKEALTAFVAFTLLYLVSGFMRASNEAKLVVLALGATYLWLRFARTRAAALIALAAAVIGPTVEIVLVRLGTFRHLQPDFAGIPMWLPALYASGSIAFGLVGLVTRLNLPS